MTPAEPTKRQLLRIILAGGLALAIGSIPLPAETSDMPRKCVPGQHRCANTLVGDRANSAIIDSVLWYCAPDASWVIATGKGKGGSFHVNWDRLHGYEGKKCPCNDGHQTWEYGRSGCIAG